jgi:hypothetical protein
MAHRRTWRTDKPVLIIDLLKYGKHDFAEALRQVSLTGIFDRLALLILLLQALWLQAL